MPIIDNLTTSSEPCELCGYHYGELHRLIPGCWDGTYEGSNCVWLCPNHHRGVHFLMAWYYCNGQGGPPAATKSEREVDAYERRFAAYMGEPLLRVFWFDAIKPIVITRMTKEGRLHPHVRSIPDEPKFRIPG